MQITRNHLLFYQQKKCVPGWGEAYQKKINIDCLIPGEKYDLDLHNLIGLLKMVRRNGKCLKTYLIKLIHSPGTIINPNKRIVISKRLLKKMGMAKTARRVI